MATNQTTNYQLNQWEPTDAVQRVDFNADNAKLDTALKSLSDQVVQKADQSALNTLISAVNQKADASTVSGLSQTVAGHTGQLAQLGNCGIYTDSYTGNNLSGSENKCSLTFPARPILVWVVKSDTREFMVLYRGISKAQNEEYTVANTVSWGTNSVSWYCSNKGAQMNEAGGTYRVYAFLDCAET